GGLQPFEVADAARRAELDVGEDGGRPGEHVVAHPHADRMPAGGAQSPEEAVLRRLLVEMEGLRVVAAGERLDLVGLEDVRAEVEAAAEIKLLLEGRGGGHGRASPPRFRNMPVLESSHTFSPRWLVTSWRQVT